MPFFLGLLAVIAVLSSVVLIFIILLQEPKGGGIAAALGGSGMEAIGPATGGVNNFTSWTAGVWMTACFLHSVLMGYTTVSVAPAPPAKTGALEPAKDTGGNNAAGNGSGDKKKAEEGEKSK